MSLRKTACVLVALGLLTLTAAAPALAGRSITAGLNFPTGDFNSTAKTGFNVGAMWTPLKVPMVDIGALGLYNYFSTEGESDGSFKAWELLAYGRVNLPALPYALVGLGASWNKLKVGEIEGDWGTDFTWALGAGYTFTMLDIMLIYHFIDAEGGSANWFALQAGLGF